MIPQILYIPPQSDKKDLRFILGPAERLTESHQTKSTSTLQQTLHLERANELHPLAKRPRARRNFVPFLNDVHKSCFAEVLGEIVWFQQRPADNLAGFDDFGGEQGDAACRGCRVIIAVGDREEALQLKVASRCQSSRG